jgi:hypothetical protein
MLIYNLRRVLALRGIDKPHAFLVKNGFPPSSASNMLSFYPVVFKVKALEKLCIALNCTPNDLFEWRASGDSVIPENHSLKTLVKEKASPIAEMVKDLPVEKLSELEAIINGLKSAE